MFEVNSNHSIHTKLARVYSVHFVSRRYEQGSTVLTATVAFKEWRVVFPGAACASVMIDRLTHHAEIQLIDGDSYRKKDSAERTTRRKSKKSEEQPNGR